MFAGIRARIGATFLGFLFLIVASVIATLWAVGGQETDAQVIYLAGRQRWLANKIAREAAVLQRHPRDADTRRALQDAVGLFGQSQQALLHGGSINLSGNQIIAFPPPARGDIRQQLQQVDETWKRLHDAIEIVVTEPDSRAALEAMGRVQTAAAAISTQMDQTVRLYEAAADRRVARLRQIQIALFVGAVMLAIFSLAAADYTTVRPIQQLVAASQRIAAGDLKTAIDGPETAVVGNEITLLGQQFEAMRRELRASYEELAALNRELEVRVEQRTQELSALHEITTDILSRLDVEQVLQSVVDKACELLNADVSALCLLDHTGQTLCLSATSGNAGEERPDKGASQPALSAGAIGEIQAAHRCATSAGTVCGLMETKLQQAHVAVPLHAGTSTIGSLCVGGSAPDQFPADGRQLLSKLANAAAVALENARLYDRVERLAALEERQRIAADMHDNVSQSLLYLQLKVDRLLSKAENKPEKLAELRQMRSALAATNEQLREIITSLRREIGDDVTVQEVLSAQAVGLQQSSDIVVELDVDQGLPMLRPEIAKQVTRIVQEALANVRKHAGADSVYIRAYRDDDTGRLIIQDNGRGFDLEEALVTPGHFGLSLMRARAARLNGRLTIDVEPGKGARLVLTWPLDTVPQQTADRAQDGTEDESHSQARDITFWHAEGAALQQAQEVVPEPSLEGDDDGTHAHPVG